MTIKETNASDWRVGDRVIHTNELKVIVEMQGDRYYTSHDNWLCIGDCVTTINIDATIRAKDATIELLNKALDLANLSSSILLSRLNGENK